MFNILKSAVRRVLLFFMAVLIFSSNVLSSTVLAGGLGGNETVSASSSPGNGSGAGYIIGLQRIDNVMETDYQSQKKSPTENFKKVSTSDMYGFGEVGYVKDFYMSMMDANGKGWNSLVFSDDWVANTAMFIPREGYTDQADRDTMKVGTTSSALLVLRAQPGKACLYGVSGGGILDNGRDLAKLDIETKKGCWSAMTQLIDLTGDFGTVGAPSNGLANVYPVNGTGKDASITFGYYTLSFSDRSEAMAEAFAKCITENAEGYYGSLAGVDYNAEVPYQGYICSNGTPVNALAGAADNLGRVLASKFCFKSNSVFDDINRFYTISVQGLSAEAKSARLSGYNLLMLGAIGRLQIFFNADRREAVEEMLKEAWINRNQDGSKSFIVVAGFMVAGQRPADGLPSEMYSYPAALQEALGGAYSISTYNEICRNVIYAEDLTDVWRKDEAGAYLPPNFPMVQEAQYTEGRANALTKALLGVNRVGGNKWMFNYWSNYCPGQTRVTGLLEYTVNQKGNDVKGPTSLESLLYLKETNYNRISSLGTFMFSGPTGEGSPPNTEDHGHESSSSETSTKPECPTSDPNYPDCVPETTPSGGGDETTTTHDETTPTETTETTTETETPSCPDCPSLPPPPCPPNDPNYPDCETETSTETQCDDCTPTPPRPDNPQVSITTEPGRKKVDSPCATANAITVNIKCSANDEQISKIYAYYEELLKTKPNAKMKMRIDLEAVPKYDDPVDQNYFNEFTKGSTDYTITSQSGNKLSIESQPFTDKGTLTQFLNGAKSQLQFMDTTITVCDKVINEYRVKMHVCFMGDAVDRGATPKGEETDGEWAYDMSTLYVNEDPYYYSAMRHVPVAEIKADEPYSERYEAMSGVPTTEDLYFGSGATEYMVNVDLKWRTEKAQRIYKFTVTNSNCYANGKACEFSCKGHKEGETCPGAAACGGPGCGGTHYRNSDHPNTCTYTVTITQPIEDYSYMDIIAQELYRLEYIDLDGNSQLHENSKIHLDPNLGYYSFYDQEGYSSGNGRLHFNVEVDSMSGKDGKRSSEEVKKSALWGDSNFTMANDIKAKHNTCINKAVSSINTAMQVLSDTYVTVVSDYTVLETSEGYQHIAFFEQDSQHENIFSQCKVDASMFGNGTIGDEQKDTSWSKEFKTEGLKFNEVKTQEQMWDNNGLCASKWQPEDITTTGYNGEFGSPMSKYDNSNDTESTNAAQLYIDDENPNLRKREGDTDFHSGHGANPRYIETDLNIHDSTTVKSAKGTTLHGTSIPLNGWQNFTDDYVNTRAWSASDKIKPVTNGEWYTGEAVVKYTQDIGYKKTNGTSFKRWCQERTAPYSPDHDRINNIVIHNPISNRDAVLISNDSKYDDRYWGALTQMPATQKEHKCPRDSSCVYSTLKCNKQQIHSTSCYKTIETGYNCGFAKNAHKHTGSCVVWLYSWELTAESCSKTDIGDIMYSTTPGEPPSKEDFVAFGGHEGCYSGCQFKIREDLDPKIWEDHYNCDPNMAGGLQCPYEGNVKAIDGNTYWIDFPGLQPPNKYFYLKKDPNNTYYNVPGQGEVRDSYEIWRRTSDNYNHLVIRYYHRDGTMGGIRCLSCEVGEGSASHTTHEGCHTYITLVDLSKLNDVGSGYFNTHHHTASCAKGYSQIVSCTDPHHYSPGEPHDVKSSSSHYPFADSRCYQPCNDDSKHNPPTNIKLPDNSAQDPTGNAFINVDRDFQIYYPDTGDFQQVPGMHGIAECVVSKGKGYVNNTDTAVWVRNKFMMIPVEVIDSSGNFWTSSEPIDLLKLPIVYKDEHKREWNDDSSKRRGLHIYTFTCVQDNSESASSSVVFLSIATNAPESYTYNDANSYVNYDRYGNKKARMSVMKTQLFDVVGSIGSLSIHDTGDPRFAELFKQPLNNGKWLIPNVVREVDYNAPNYVVADNKDVRLEPTADGVNDKWIAYGNGGVNGRFHNTYGVFDGLTIGGKGRPYVELPLTSLKNNIVALQKEHMRPGYNLYMDIETLGLYIGENTYCEDGSLVIEHQPRTPTGIGSYEKFMQVTPTYYELDLQTGKYKPVDVYMKSGESYAPVYLTDKTQEVNEYYNYLKWIEESARRSFTSIESKRSSAVAKAVEQNPNNGVDPSYHMRLPTNDADVLGTPKKLFLVDTDRTFIGSSIRYGVDENRVNSLPDGRKKEKGADERWYSNSQRWHFTLGLPSSTVFVYAGTKPSNLTKFQQDIKTIQNKNAVIVCTINIRVRGKVWTLEYDGTALNSKGLTLPYGDTPKHYEPPKEPDDPHRDPKKPADPNKPVKDPIVVVYDNRRTSADDMQTQGTH